MHLSASYFCMTYWLYTNYESFSIYLFCYLLSLHPSKDESLSMYLFSDIFPGQIELNHCCERVGGYFAGLADKYGEVWIFNILTGMMACAWLIFLQARFE